MARGVVKRFNPTKGYGFIQPGKAGRTGHPKAGRTTAPGVRASSVTQMPFLGRSVRSPMGWTTWFGARCTR